MSVEARADLVVRLERRAAEVGFGLFGVTDVEPSAHMGFYQQWIDEGYNGEMAYLARPDAISRRADLGETMGSIRSVMVVGHEYYAPDAPDVGADRSSAVVARYARGVDYHHVVTAKLSELLEWLDGEVPGGVRGRAYVDTGPLLERELA